jgi:hypothetical protein
MCHAELSGSMPSWFAWTAANAASLIKQFIPLVNLHFCLWFCSKQRMESHLNCKPQTYTRETAARIFPFSTADTIFTTVSIALQVERFG